MPTGSAAAEVAHWRTRAELAERNVRLLLGAIRDMHKRADAAMCVAERIGKEQGA